MIELDRHIEILLLSNDCVIVPDLGGFMAHYVEAHYDERDHSFIPPMRTLGFNPMLKLNDSLLVQSYIEAYDLSYPEALRRIENEVEELKQTLEIEGSYELNDIGVLSRNDDGKMVFSPCEAGILTPELYGLSSFEMKPLQKTQPVLSVEPVMSDSDPEVIADESAPEPEVEEESQQAIIIKMSWIRNAVAVAAAILAFFLLSTPITNSSHLNMSNLNNVLLMGMLPKDTNMEMIDIKRPVTPVVQKTAKKADSISIVKSTIENLPSEVKPAHEAVPVPESEDKFFCIVLASYVSQKNAEAFVSQLKKDGHAEAEIFMRNDVRRVIYGRFSSESDAYNKLQALHNQKDFKEAWVMKIKENS